MSLLSDLGTKIGTEFKADRDRLDILEAGGSETTSKYPTSIILGNNDWTDLLDSITGCSYSAVNRGLYVAGASIWKILNIKFPIDPNKSYRYTIRVKKISGTGTFYAGVASYDTNGNHLQTDRASSYNYGTASRITVAAGATQTFTGVYSGYNLTTDADRNKFDPEASYFSPMFICNYQGSGDSVIESIEIETISDYAGASSGKVLQVLNYTNNSTTATTTTDYNHFDVTVTPKSATSKFFIVTNMKASHSQSNSLYFKIGINDNFDLASGGRGYPSATGSIHMEAYGSSHSSNAQIDQYIGDYMYSHNSASAFNVKIQHHLQGGTMYLNYAYSYDDLSRGRPQSTLQIWEIEA